jgi:hypothetical protein
MTGEALEGRPQNELFMQDAPRQRSFLGRTIHAFLWLVSGILLALLGLISYVWYETHEFFPVIPLGVQTPVSVYVSQPGEVVPQEISYGAQPLLAQPNFYSATKKAFIDSKQMFITADLTTMTVEVYEDGVVTETVPIAAKGRVGSWWETPAGLYRIESKTPSHFSSIGKVYQPWSMAFQGNFFIHGWPHYEDGTPVSGSYSGGCIRLQNEDSKRVYDRVKVGTPILVYASAGESDAFQYTATPPAVTAQGYFVADITNGAILAARNEDVPADVGATAQVVTSLVAADYINLSKDILIDGSTLATTTYPRLKDRSSVSAYALLFPLLIEGSHESAEVLASELGHRRFTALMNTKADALGMHESVFASASGSTTGNLSTPDDLFHLLKHLYNDRRFVISISAEQPVSNAFPQTEFADFTNINRVEDILGSKGGFIRQNGKGKETGMHLFEVMVRRQKRIMGVVVTESQDAKRDIEVLQAYIERMYSLQTTR